MACHAEPVEYRASRAAQRTPRARFRSSPSTQLFRFAFLRNSTFCPRCYPHEVWTTSR
ncbi:hypothetical protein BSLA_01f1957 [Burkholderia stabilis]|nr:hypothetical protein BSLA_01f1957 [Burkholderia stabilis]